MEEDKAAALYESLSKKGLGAARFKQGLGFGASGGGALENAAAPISFTKAGADFSTEIEAAEKQPRGEDDEVDRLVARRRANESARVVQSIADKLRGRSSRRRGRGTDSEGEEDERRLAERRRGSDSEEERRSSDKRKRGDSDDERRDRRRRNSSEDSRKGPAGRDGDSARADSPAHGESSDEDMARERRIADRRKEDAQKAKKSDRSDKGRGEKGRESNRREERFEERRGREDRSPQIDTRKRARSRSRDRERRGVKERSPDRRRNRSREDLRRSERHDRVRRREEPLERSKERGHHRHGKRSSRRERSDSRERGRGRRESVKEKTNERAVIDYAEIIRGYENMSAAEKLKARTKYALSQTAVKDSAKGLSTEWERYAFDATAPLDEDAQQDKYGDDTKAADDASHLLNTGSTFGIAKAQAVREAEKQAAHDAAIFGLPVDRSGDAAPGGKQPEKGPVFVPGDSEEDEEDRPVIVEEGPQGEEPQADPSEQPKAEAPVKVAAPSWKERALKAQQAKRDAARAAPG